MYGMLGNFGGIKIVASNYWPQVADGTEIVRFKADPIICWLAKYFPVLPYVEAEYTKYRDSDPIMYGDKILCSHSQANRIRRELK